MKTLRKMEYQTQQQSNVEDKNSTTKEIKKKTPNKLIFKSLLTKRLNAFFFEITNDLKLDNKYRGL